MSDLRREPLISIGSKSAINDKTKAIKRCVRISVTLPESTEDGYPEINFRQELAAWEEKHISNFTHKRQNGLDSFNDDDDDVRRVAQELEAKYGISAKKKRRKIKKDVGLGYDESDSFIDNTECYDEIIPKNITTLLGGFYINSGALEFKPVDGASSNESSSSSSEDEDVAEKPTKKRPLVSSSDSDSDEKQKSEIKEKKPKISNGNTNGLQKAIKNKLFSDDKIKKVKKTSDDDKKKAVRDLLKERRENLLMSQENIGVGETSLGNVDTVIESVIDAVNGTSTVVIDDSSRDSSGSKENQNKVLAEDGDSNDVPSLKPEEIVKLPDNLPTDMLPLIEEIKKAAAQSTEGKVKFFSGPVSTTLLNLERKCRTLKKSSRVRIYEHLAPFVRCRKETLIKRAKNLFLEDEQKKVKNMMSELHRKVQTQMPNLVKNYEIECQKVLQIRSTKEETENDESKSVRMPKRRFLWSEDTKKLLREIVSLQKKCFLMEGRNKDKMEDLINSFLKSHVQVLWPEGWISLKILQKQCNMDVKKQINDGPSLNTKQPIDSEGTKDQFVPKILSPITSKSSSLTITPIIPIDAGKAASDQLAKVKASLPSDIMISDVNSFSASNYNRSLPVAKSVPEQMNKHSSVIVQELDELQLIKQAIAEDLSQKRLSQKPTTVDNQIKVKDGTTTQVIELTSEPVELKRKPGPKSKTKYYVEDPEKPIKIKKATSEKGKNIMSKEEDRNYENLTGSYALDKLISDSFVDTKCFPSSLECTPVISNCAGFKQRHNQEGDENQIQEVLEGLRVLQKMSSPAKTDDFGRTSAPASVITYNSKSQPSAPQKNENKKSAAAFHDAFQKQFIQFNMLKNNQSATASNSKNDFNSFNNKYQPPPMPNDAKKQSDIYFNKLFNNVNCQPQGSYTMLQDMFTNLLKESCYQTAPDKSNAQQK